MGVLSNSQFCVTLFTIVCHKVIESIQRIDTVVIKEFILRKKDSIKGEV